MPVELLPVPREARGSLHNSLQPVETGSERGVSCAPGHPASKVRGLGAQGSGKLGE